MSDVDRSQSGEQGIILKMASTLPVGRFLDIGAGDGQTFSNTHALARAGWSGVCVEPAPWMFERLIECYHDRKDIECVNAVVTGNHTGLIDFYYTLGDHLSSTSLAHTKTWSEVSFQRMTSVGVKLHDLLDYFDGGFSVVSIDTEGTTLELLEVYRFHPAWRDVHVVCVEFENDSQREAIKFPRRFPHRVETENNVILAR